MKLRKTLFEVGRWITLVAILFGPAGYILMEFPFEFTNSQLTKGIFIIAWFVFVIFIYFNILIKNVIKGEENVEQE